MTTIRVGQCLQNFHRMMSTLKHRDVCGMRTHVGDVAVALYACVYLQTSHGEKHGSI